MARHDTRTGRKDGPRVRRGKTSVIAERFLEGIGVLLAVLAVYVTLALLTYNPLDPSLNNAVAGVGAYNWAGRVGAYVSDYALMLFGLGAYLLVGFLIYHAVNCLMHREGPSVSLQVVTVPLLLVTSCVLLLLADVLPAWGPHGFGNGGLVGKLMASLLVPLLGNPGCALLMLALWVLALLWLTGWTLAQARDFVLWCGRVGMIFSTVALRWLNRLRAAVPAQFELPLSHAVPARPRPRVMLEEDAPAPRPSTRREVERQTTLPLGDGAAYTLPPLDLLDNPKPKKGGETEESLAQNARRIEAELKSFGVIGTVTNIRPGPVITIYELEPAAGVKSSTIMNLQDDLARAMSALSIRIAPIPGRTVLGIEVPNRERQFISLKELFDTEVFEQDPGKLTVALGVDTAGQPAFADISKFPHALIAGTTGSGKSVAINAFILSLLYRMTPDELRLVLVDPKMLELSIYNDIPHLLTPVITDPNKAAAALNWVVKEMENRYKLMSELSVKNLASFNARFAELEAEGKIPTRLVQVGFDLETGQPRFEEQPLATKPMPYIVVVIDELADLMMVAGKAVEFSIARLTQMARASGIHMLVATQRPSVDVVTGLIKANIPTRMSFNVASKIDSRTVLDAMGADALLGKGDMLMLANGSNGLQRMHGAFVSEEECNKVADYIRAQGKANYVEDVFKAGVAVPPNGKGAPAEDGEEGGEDLYQKAVEIVVSEQKASTSYLQRALKIGYNKAADLIDRMERDGVISAPSHTGKREVLK